MKVTGERDRQGSLALPYQARQGMQNQADRHTGKHGSMRLDVRIRRLGVTLMVEFFMKNFQKPTVGVTSAGIIWKIMPMSS